MIQSQCKFSQTSLWNLVLDFKSWQSVSITRRFTLKSTPFVYCHISPFYDVFTQVTCILFSSSSSFLFASFSANRSFNGLFFFFTTTAPDSVTCHHISPHWMATHLFLVMLWQDWTLRREGRTVTSNVLEIVTRKDNIRNELIRWTLKVDRFGWKVREWMLRWYGHVKGRDVDYIGRTGLEMKLPGKSNASTNEDVFGYGYWGHAGSSSEGRWKYTKAVLHQSVWRIP